MKDTAGMQNETMRLALKLCELRKFKERRADIALVIALQLKLDNQFTSDEAETMAYNNYQELAQIQVGLDQQVVANFLATEFSLEELRWLVKVHGNPIMSKLDKADDRIEDITSDLDEVRIQEVLRSLPENSFIGDDGLEEEPDENSPAVYSM